MSLAERFPRLGMRVLGTDIDTRLLERAQLSLARLASRLRPGGALVIGLHEQLPQPAAAFEPWPGCRAIYRLRDPTSRQ